MSQMRRFMSFRDFDWALLGMVLAALHHLRAGDLLGHPAHASIVGFHTKQIYWIVGGRDGDVHLLAKIDYHRCIDWVPWAYGVCLVCAGRRPGWSATRRWARGAGSSSGPCTFSPRSG